MIGGSLGRLFSTLSFFLLISLAFFTVGIPLAGAQGNETLKDGPDGPGAPWPGIVEEGPEVSCFDYYTFGSVQVDLNPQSINVFNGDKLVLEGTVTNENPYPVVDGQVYLKVFQLSPDRDEDALKTNGWPLVDFVLLKEDVNIPANGTIDLSTEWQVPDNVAEGNYQAAFFFTTSHRYNLQGLTFTDDVTGNVTDFSVSRASAYQPVHFDKDTVKLNGNAHSFALPPNTFLEYEPVIVTATLVNNNLESKTVKLNWTTYEWDGISESNQVETYTEEITVDPQDSIDVSRGILLTESAVTFVEVRAVDGDASSVLHVRYLRDGVGEPRINYPALYNYPIKAGEETTIFSCLHSTNLPLLEGASLELVLKDGTGKTVHSYSYEGNVTGAMMGVKDTFESDKDYNDLSLKATLRYQGEVVEEVVVEYSCADLDPGNNCQSETSGAGDFGATNSKLIATIVLLLIVIGLVILLALRHRRGATTDGFVTGEDDNQVDNQ